MFFVTHACLRTIAAVGGGWRVATLRLCGPRGAGSRCDQFHFFRPADADDCL
jgi:hypothetical protein